MNQHSQMWEELVLGKEECVRDVTVKNKKKKKEAKEISGVIFQTLIGNLFLFLLLAEWTNMLLPIN